MRKFISTVVFTLITLLSWSQHCLAPISLNQKITESSVIVEGKVLSQQATWDVGQGMIYTLSTIEVTKVFKGSIIGSQVTVSTMGGQVGLEMIVAEPELELAVGDIGVFTLIPSQAKLNKKGVFEAYSGPQGFIKYDEQLQSAVIFDTKYPSIANDLYTAIHTQLGQSYTQIKKLQRTPRPKSVSAGGSITSFSPTTVSAGTKTVLTISGSGFGATQGSSYVGFKDADNGGASYIQPIATEYISWSNTQIQVEVTSDAGTGTIIVSDGTNTLTSSTNLTVDYAITNISNSSYKFQSNHVSDNGSGGYTFQEYTGFNANSAASADFDWALEEWRCNSDINWHVVGTTATNTIASDGVNVVRFDIGTELPAGVLGRCTSRLSGCGSAPNLKWYITEIDVVFDDGTNWFYGGGTIGASQYDFRSVALHEMGHGHQLGHVINTNQVMHYNISNGEQNATISTQEEAGAAYQMNLSTTDARCGQSLMVADGCNNPPVANFSVDGPAICASNGLTVQFNNTSTFSPTSYEWDVNGDGTVDYSTASPSHTYPSAGLNTVKLKVSNAHGADSMTVTIYVGAGDPATVCTPTTTNAGNFDAGIVTVAFDDINHTDNSIGSTGSANQGYFDFSCTKNTIVSPGSTYSFTATCGTANPPKCAIWIDYNNDGTFNNTNEQVYLGTTAQTTHTGNITIPSNATTGVVLRMRVYSYVFNSPGACIDSDYGEINDYGVLIQCSGNPTPDVATLSTVTGECSATASTPTATDPCTGGTINGTTSDPTTYNSQGSYSITWSYAGTNGTVTQTQNVVVDDVSAPIADQGSLSDVTAQCSVSSLTAPTATDNCAGSLTGTHNASLPINTQGTTVVTWTYNDGNGNTSTQNQNVVIDDTQAPVADNASLTTVTDQCQVNSLTAPTATDNCEGAITGTTNQTFPITAQGTTTVTWTYNDGNGNTSTQTQDVVINDNQAPVADNASLADINEPCQVTTLTSPTATDNCSGTITGTHNANLPITQQGTTVVTWTYTDAAGNSSTQNQNVNIADNSAPVANNASLADITDECEVTSLTAPTASDNCSGTVNGTHNANLPITTQGTTVVTWTYTDAAGNSSTQNQNVIIDDVSAPVANNASLADVTDECEVTTLTAPTATDNCAGTLNGTHNASLPITTQGTTVVTWTYDDGNGNTTTQNQNVVIDDVSAPVANQASLQDVTDECQVTTLTAPTATDNCTGTITGTHNASLPISTQGTTVVTWTYTDGNGNTSTQNQNVVIDDVSAPVADNATLSDITAQCQVTSLTAPTATDNCTGSITGTHNASLPITSQGTTVVTWTYNDGNGNISTQNQNVIIDDTQAPVADNASLSTVSDNCQVNSLPSPTATDNCSGSITATTNQSFPITQQGTTTVTWTYDDGNGNSSTQTQDVVINDNQAPVPDNASLADINEPCQVTSLTAPSSTDNCSGTVNGTHNANLPITQQGTTVVTWTYTDAAGNSTTQNQNVNIADNSAPVANNASLADITDECEVTTLTAPTANDNCSGTVNGTHNANLPITTQGTTVVTWTYTDATGNTSTQSQNVVIDDVTPPVANQASLQNVTAECEVTSLTAPTATDNCSGTVTGSHNANLPITGQGTTVVTWTYDDGQGNTSTQSQNVVIDDVSAPVANQGNLPNIPAECEVTSLTSPTATDNCSGSITGSHNANLPITSQGTTVVTWTYDDGNGNTSTQTQNVVIDDVSAPVANQGTLQNITAECEVTSLTAPTASDNCSGTITGTHNANLPINVQGTTVVTWTYDDGNGNTSTQTQNVVITDASAPIANLSSLATLTDECEVSTLIAPTATDNCAGTVNGTHNANLPITTQGTTVVTWTYDDGNGNISTQTQDVIITDITAPVADLASLADITAECEVTTLTAPTATDNCVGTINGTHNASLPISTQGTTVVTWTYDDGHGNTVTQDQNIVIDDQSAPVITDCPTDISISANAAGCSANVTWNAPSATDNCSTVSMSSTHASGDNFALGTTLVSYTFTDAAGNVEVCEFNVIVSSDLSASGAVIDASGFTATGSIDLTVVQGQAPYQFDWDNDGTGDFDDTEDLTNLIPGVYTVVIRDANGCEHSESFTVDAGPLGIEEETNKYLKVYPNPATDVLYIEWNKSGIEEVKITLQNALGQEIQRISTIENGIEINLSGYAKGVYFVALVKEGSKELIRVVKQ